MVALQANLNLASFGYMVKILFMWDSWSYPDSTFGFAIPLGTWLRYFLCGTPGHMLIPLLVLLFQWESRVGNFSDDINQG
jgi:hypothetical protein